MNLKLNVVAPVRGADGAHGGRGLRRHHDPGHHLERHRQCRRLQLSGEQHPGRDLRPGARVKDGYTVNYKLLLGTRPIVVTAIEVGPDRPVPGLRGE